jgi:hypothetical protein
MCDSIIGIFFSQKKAINGTVSLDMLENALFLQTDELTTSSYSIMALPHNSVIMYEMS